MAKCECKILWLFDFISKKWVLLILKALWEWMSSFTEIKTYLWWVNSKILSQRLTELEEAKFIKRNVINEKPIKIRYELTEKWADLWNELVNFEKWIKKWEK